MAVFEETADAIWGSVSSASTKDTLVEAFDHLITSSRKIADDFPGHSAFLASLPLEARFHPEFEKLMERRAEFKMRHFNLWLHSEQEQENFLLYLKLN